MIKTVSGFIVGVIALMLSVPAMSTTLDKTLSQTQNQNQTQETASTATAQQGNEQNINFITPGVTESTQRVKYSGTQTIKNTPSVSGPPLTTSNDTCMGSTSGSVNIAGLGIGGGSTWTDTNCKRLKNARELWNMGMKAASMALLCKDADNKEALEATGFDCSFDKKTNNDSPDKAKLVDLSSIQPDLAQNESDIVGAGANSMGGN